MSWSRGNERTKCEGDEASLHEPVEPMLRVFERPHARLIGLIHYACRICGKAGGVGFDETEAAILWENGDLIYAEAEKQAERQIAEEMPESLDFIES
jgi:hypothetical protein